MMHLRSIPFSETGCFSKLVLDYLQDHPDIRPFYEYRPDNEGIRQALKTRKGFDLKTRSILAERFKAQYQNLPISEAVKKNIEALKAPNTFTVTTGHQLQLFTGPLYFIYKTLSTIRLSQAIAQEHPGHTIVPVFWLASEDHDKAEIDHIHLFGKTYSWETEQQGAVGCMSTASIAPLLQEMQGLFQNDAEGQALLNLFKKAYSEHADLAQATRALLNELFGKYGLLVLDGNDKALKKLFAPIIAKDIVEQNSYRLIEESSTSLSKHYPIQIKAREINFFYLDAQTRERIIEGPSGSFKVNNTSITFTKEELLKKIESEPERFSPNVATRPLYQESILPNLVYIGGGAEVAYWMQLKACFHYYKIPFPIIALRHSFLLLEEPVLKRIKELGFPEEAFFTDADQLKKLFIAKQNIQELSLDAEKASLQTTYQELQLRLSGIDPTLKASVEGEYVKAVKGLEQLEAKGNKAIRQRFEQHLQKIDKIKERLFPEGILQERHNTILQFSALVKSFDSILQQMPPFSINFHLLTENQALANE